MTSPKHKKKTAEKEKQPKATLATQASKPTESKQVSSNIVFIGKKTNDELYHGLHNPLQPTRHEEGCCQS